MISPYVKCLRLHPTGLRSLYSPKTYSRVSSGLAQTVHAQNLQPLSLSSSPPHPAIISSTQALNPSYQLRTYAYKCPSPKQ